MLVQVRQFIVAMALLCGLWLSGCCGRSPPSPAATPATSTPASTKQSRSSSETRGFEPDDGPPSPIQNKYRATWAVIIGIDEYQSGKTGLAPLKFAVNDAREIRKTLCEEFGYTDDHVRYLTNSKATREAIRDVFEQWLPQHDLQDSDSLFVFFAGHGLIDDATKRGYLAAVDSTGEDLEKTCIAVSWLKDCLDNLPCRHKVVVLDSCYSGSLFKSRGASASSGKDGAGNENSPQPVDSSGQVSRGRRLGKRVRGNQLDNISYYFQHQAFLGMSAGRLTPVADGRAEDQHSVFTREFLKVLRERANSPRGDHAFTFRQLAGRVEAEVAYALGSRQIPDWGQLGDGDGDFVFRPQGVRRETPRELAMKSNAGHLVNRLHSSVNLSPEGFFRQIREIRQLDDFRRWVIPELTKKLEPPAPHPEATEEQRVNLGKQRADAAIALFNLDDPETAVKFLQFKEDAETLTQFVHRCKDRGVMVEQLVVQLHAAMDRLAAARMSDPDGDHSGKVTVCFGLLLALGQYGNEDELVKNLGRWYREDRSSAIHSACGWLLRKWGQGQLVEEADRHLAQGSKKKWFDPTKEWFVLELNADANENDRVACFTFIVFEPGEFLMGSPLNETDRDPENLEKQHVATIERRFAICDREVTHSQLKRLIPEAASEGHSASPATYVSWHNAQEYCREFTASAKLSLPQAEQDPLRFRLPSEKEWEYACRAGTITRFSFGSDDDVFVEYGSSQEVSHASVMLRPNIRGLFDVHGSVKEWCEDLYSPYGEPPMPPVLRVVRGGGGSAVEACRSAARLAEIPTSLSEYFGFRLCVTLPHSD